jgi:hypothetical protein
LAIIGRHLASYASSDGLSGHGGPAFPANRNLWSIRSPQTVIRGFRAGPIVSDQSSSGGMTCDPVLADR